VRTLIVDDEPSVLETYRLILEQLGYAVRVAASARQAKGLLDGERFDLVLCDLTLEEHHAGFGVIEHARRANPGIAAILMTGYADEDVMKIAETKDIRTVFFKPVVLEDLLRAIDDIGQQSNP